jgi:penicillin-binding protein 1A
MKYFFLTITFLAVLVLLTVGLILYTSYMLWLKDKEGVLARLTNLKETLEKKSTGTVALTSDLKKSANTVIFDREGRVIGEFATGRRKILAFDDLPPLLVNTVVIMEDEKFYSHGGIYLPGIVGALYEDVRTLSFTRGGSTITQQLAKNLFTDSRKTIKRKIYELFCTIEIERRFSKDDIVTLYLNSINFGHFNYGVGNAARFYFNKDVFHLNLYEVAALVGLIPNPSRFSPLVSQERCRRKQKIVLNKMIDYRIADSETVLAGFDSFWEGFSKLIHQPNVSIWSMEKNLAPYFVEQVRRELEPVLGPERIKRGGLRIYTSLDLEYQRAAEEALREGLELQELRTSEILRGAAAEKNGPGTMLPDRPVEGALVALHPRSGYILSMVGGRAFTFENQFNRAVSSSRQIGSAFKPFVFAAAIEKKGYGPESRFNDRPLVIDAPGGKWRPSNYKGEYYGNVTLSYALVKSLNSVSVQLTQEVGPDAVIGVLGSALGMKGEEARERFKPHLSLALGVYSFSPLEIARAYAIFPNMGEKVYPLSVLRVEDEDGNVLIDNEGEAKKGKIVKNLDDDLRVIKRSTAETMVAMMGDVLKRDGTAYRAIVSSGLIVVGGGKTGTTNDYTDAWFIGFTKDIVAAVWVGFDDPRFSLGDGQAGGVVAAPIWANFLKKALWRE